MLLCYLSPCSFSLKHSIFHLLLLYCYLSPKEAKFIVDFPDANVRLRCPPAAFTKPCISSILTLTALHHNHLLPSLDEAAGTVCAVKQGSCLDDCYLPNTEHSGWHVAVTGNYLLSERFNYVNFPCSKQEMS